MTEVAERYGKLLTEVDKHWKAASRRGDDATCRPGCRAASPACSTAPIRRPTHRCALDWGFLSLFPDRATQGEYQKLLRRRRRLASRRARRGRWCWTTRRGRTSRASSCAATPATPASRCRGSSCKLASPEPQAVRRRQRPARTGPARSLSKDNPLTARVFVNRVWMHHFGKRPGRHAQRLRPAQRPADAPGIARLARRGVRGPTNGWSHQDSCTG